MQYAIKHGQNEMVQVLLQAGAKIDEVPFFFALMVN